MTSDPEPDGRIPRRFLEPPEDFDKNVGYNEASIEDFEVSYHSEPNFITQIEGNLDLETQLLRNLEQGLTPEEAVGKLDLYTGNVQFWRLEKSWYKLNEEEAARLFLYRSISSSKDYIIEKELKAGAAKHLGLSSVVTENTIESTSEKVDKQIGTDVNHRLRAVMEQLKEHDKIATLPDPASDGRGEPPVVLISREMRK